MRRFACVVTVLSIVTLSVASVQATTLIANGDFSTDAGLFVEFPGYTGGANPVSIPGWFALGNGNVGVNGLDTGFGTPNVFGPTDPSAVRDFAFIQGSSLLAQSVSLTVGQQYRLDLLLADRGDAPGGVAQIWVADADHSYFHTADIVPSPAAFGALSYTFTPDTINGGLVYVVIDNVSTVGGSSIAFSNISLTAVPEPSTLVLTGMGLVGLLAYAWRKRK